MKIKYCLELFAGSSRFAMAMGRLGYYVIAIDIRFGEDHDLLSSKLRGAIMGWVQAKAIFAILAGFICSSFSKARNMPGGPPPLRNSENVAGFPDLRPGDAKKVAMGNLFLRWCIKLLRACIVTRTVCVLENPFTSWAWSMPEVTSVRRLAAVEFWRTDFCQWGTEWRKATGLLSAYLEYQPCSRVCTGRGICSRTNRPHQILKGQRADGVFWTLIAEPYPKIFCRCLARAVVRSIHAIQARHIARILG